MGQSIHGVGDFLFLFYQGKKKISLPRFPFRTFLEPGIKSINPYLVTSPLLAMFCGSAGVCMAKIIAALFEKMIYFYIVPPRKRRCYPWASRPQNKLAARGAALAADRIPGRDLWIFFIRLEMLALIAASAEANINNEVHYER